jgi:hypothetical protein
MIRQFEIQRTTIDNILVERYQLENSSDESEEDDTLFIEKYAEEDEQADEDAEKFEAGYYF